VIQKAVMNTMTLLNGRIKTGNIVYKVLCYVYCWCNTSGYVFESMLTDKLVRTKNRVFLYIVWETCYPVNI